jgi:hypothetical protein
MTSVQGAGLVEQRRRLGDEGPAFAPWSLQASVFASECWWCVWGEGELGALASLEQPGVCVWFAVRFVYVPDCSCTDFPCVRTMRCSSS